MKTVKKIIVAVIMIFLFYSLTRNLFSYRKNIQFYKEYQKRFQEITKRNIELKTTILRQNDPLELEKTIRNKLNLQKPNELVVILPVPSPSPTPSPTPTIPVYRQWVELFF